jgi:hypothetical protein
MSISSSVKNNYQVRLETVSSFHLQQIEFKKIVHEINFLSFFPYILYSKIAAQKLIALKVTKLL